MRRILSILLLLGVANGAAIAAEKKDSNMAPQGLTEEQKQQLRYQGPIVAKDITKPKNDYNITINYELGMHCTGFDFTYCCVLPPYNSIQSQVIKTGKGPKGLPTLLAADEKDPTVVIDEDDDKRMRLKYGHINNSFSEGAKLFYWRVPYDVDGDGKYEDDENVANAYLDHLYIYKDLEGSNPKKTSKDSEKLHIGHELKIPTDSGPSGQPLNNGFLKYSGDTGTIVYTKGPVLDNVPIVLTNPGIWEALGLPLTPFEDDVSNRNPLHLVETDITPYQEARVALVDADSGKPVIDSHTGKPVAFVGTNPIDVPNCSNCHANENANGKKHTLYKQEKAFWKGLGANDWIAGLKATSVSVLELHDAKHGTDFLANYKPEGRSTTNRLGRDPVLCQKCHADNVIGVIKAKKVGDVIKNAERPDEIIEPLSQAIHTAHLNKRSMSDSQGRTGACQGCHPAHREDHTLDNYPITADGRNPNALKDNRDSKGGCYVGRDVHSNPNKDKDGAETPEHLNAIGTWLQNNVSQIGGDNKGGKGLWCTNCHNQLSRELYQRDHITSAFTQEGETLRNKSLKEIAAALNLTEKELTDHWMDPRTTPSTFSAKKEDMVDIMRVWARDRLVPDIAVIATKGGKPLIKKDEDGDINVTILSADPKVDLASLELPEGADGAVAVPYDAATHGRDYWLSPGVPHCADCHAAPFVEGQGGVAFPINQPGKYSSMRYSKGHAGLSCQSCHQSIHGLFPVAPRIDTTSYNQPPQYNPDGSHGPLKCPACHESNKNGVAIKAAKKKYKGVKLGDSFDAAVSWIHENADDDGGVNP